MSAADLVLRNFNLFVDGRGYAGNILEFTPPALKVKEQEFRAGGMDSSITLDMGMEKMEAKFTLSQFNPEILKLWGLLDGSHKQFTARGSVESQNGTKQPVVIQMSGTLRQVESGAWKPGDKVELKFTASLVSYRYTQAGTTLVDIDVLNMKRVIGGVDQLAQQRANLGL